MAGLGDMLVRQGVLTDEQLVQAEEHQQLNGGNLAQSLVQLRLATEADLVGALASAMGMEYVSVEAPDVDPMAAALLPGELARRHSVLPVRFGEDNEVVVAIADPNTREALVPILTEAMGVPVRLGLAPRRALLEAIEATAVDGDGPPAGDLRAGGGDPHGRGPGGPVPGPGAAGGGLGNGNGAPGGLGAAPPAGPSSSSHDALGNGHGPGPGGDEPRGPAAREDEAVLPRGARSPVAAVVEEPRLASEEETSIDLDELLQALVDRGGSDLHLTVGIPPAMRVNGELAPMQEYPVLEANELQKLLYSIMTQKQREVFENELELDMSYSIPNVARFRVNVFQQRDAVGSVMRVIPFEILPLENLGIPEQVSNFAYLPRGFVLVTGPTGSGKSTTLASLVDLANRNRASHIMTVEDPIEFLHQHKRSVVNQREVGTDTHGFAEALKHVLRQDPDVILVGEMRDLETIQIALTAAETGHLVFGTLHTQDAPQSIDRIIDVFPPHQQEQIRVMLAGALKGVVCQTLVKTADGKGRTAACEVMVANSGVKNLIREGKTHQIYSAIQAGAKDGMIAMDQSLALLVKAGKISYDAALEKCNQVQEFNRLAGRA